MSTRRLIAESLAPLVDFVYPPRCPACGESVGEQGGLCTDCWSDLRIPGEPSCATCQRPFGEAGPAHGAICAPCLSNPPLHDGIAAGALYGETSRKLILALKHGRRIALAPLLARLIAARLPADGIARIIVPVPLHRGRLWQRGYNQAALLAQELAGMGYGDLAVDALVRRKATPSLGGLGSKARSKALAGAIEVRTSRKPPVDGADIMLVDDVLTSGATSLACTKALKKAGARSVVIACFARVLDEARDAAGRAA
ncbi:ComF family protein [Qipengyuania sp. XHP0207]|uniref:ComF family protein n=1 Tax=Qipengyuania sp. XHP0207 TaxID=3038078 RepID=UPI00241D4877|nr:ComF family protein [Qipengyuania sp. XHP0207]MDG5749392.1 ComF family protein [Qipengyuania sp. XHP0207]